MKERIERMSQKERVRRIMLAIMELVKLVPNPEKCRFTVTLDSDGYAQNKDGTYQRSWFLSDGSVAPIKKR